MFYKLLIFILIMCFIGWFYLNVIHPIWASDKAKNSSTDKKGKSLVDEYSENEVTYRTNQERLAMKSEEQLKKAEKEAAEAQAIQEQLKNKN